MAKTYFDDRRFQDLMMALLVKDTQFLRLSAHLLDPKDFKPRRGSDSDASHRYVIAQLGLKHFEKYRSPIKDLLTASLLEHCKKTNMASESKAELMHYAKRLLRRKITAVDAITDKLIQFKREKLKDSIIQEMIDLQGNGGLTDDKWAELSRRALDTLSETPYYVADYLEKLEERIDRRAMARDNRFPVLLIEPLDAIVRAIARSHVGLVLAPYKRGKSLMLIYIACAYLLQRLNVLFITLEDPPQDVEDRFDACVTHLPIKKLNVMPKKLRERFLLFKRLLRSKLKIVDGTERKITTATIESIWEEERNKGFTADVIIVDYDDEIAPLKKHPERRMEIADIYREIRQLASRKNVILWTAAQTKRDTGHKKQLGGDDAAEDISKIRKVTFALSLGAGDWGPDSIYLFVAAHKFDRQHVGTNIMTNRDRMLIYDREATVRAFKNPEKFIEQSSDRNGEVPF